MTTSTDTDGAPWIGFGWTSYAGVPAGSWGKQVGSVTNSAIFTYFDKSGAQLSGHDHAVFGLSRPDHRDRWRRRGNATRKFTYSTSASVEVGAVSRRRLSLLLGREDGIAMILVVIIGAFLTLISVTLIDVVRAEGDRGAHANWSAASFQAAEAGLDDYSAKLVDDHGYFLHAVHPAESTRRPDLWRAGAAQHRLRLTDLQRQDDARRRVGLQQDVELPQRQGQLVPVAERLLLQPADLPARDGEQQRRRRRASWQPAGAR